MNIYAKNGDKVKFVGSLRKDNDTGECIREYPSVESIHWGSNDDPVLLTIGSVYTIQYTDVHSWHTKVILQEFPNQKFNSVWFEDATEKDEDMELVIESECCSCGCIDTDDNGTICGIDDEE